MFVEEKWNELIMLSSLCLNEHFSTPFHIRNRWELIPVYTLAKLPIE